MILRLAVCPSFSDGFGVEIIDQALVGATQPTNTNYIIRTKGLPCPSLVSAAQLDGLFSALRTSQPLNPDAAAPIAGLVRGVRVGIPSQEWVTCDGTPTSLSIHSGDLLLALEWNP